jgi:hypothetical protein
MERKDARIKNGGQVDFSSYGEDETIYLRRDGSKIGDLGYKRAGYPSIFR